MLDLDLKNTVGAVQHYGIKMLRVLRRKQQN